MYSLLRITPVLFLACQTTSNLYGIIFVGVEGLAKRCVTRVSFPSRWVSYFFRWPSLLFVSGGGKGALGAGSAACRFATGYVRRAVCIFSRLECAFVDLASLASRFELVSFITRLYFVRVVTKRC